MTNLNLESLIEASQPWAKEIVKTKILPVIYTKISSIVKDVKASRYLNNQMEGFLAKIKGSCSLMNTLAFQNTPVELLKIYEPLSVTLDTDNDYYECVVNNNPDFISEFKHILITDSAGMGKSTLLKRISLDCIDSGKFIPIYIELRQIRDYSIATQIQYLLGLSGDVSNDCIKKIPFIYLLDGVDEVPQSIKNKVIKLLKEFSDEFSESKIIITSRHDGFLSELGSFSRFKIQPLEPEQAYNLLRRYDKSGKTSSRLINGLKLEDGKNLNDFLSTPLYVSLLFCAYKFKPIIPRKKDLFYSQVFDALYESHDLTKELGYVREKHSKLDSTEFHQVLRKLGFKCLKEQGKIEFTKDDLQIALSEIISNTAGVVTSPSLFIRDILETVPIFVKEGATIRWSHKSLMEYFAAMFICRDTKGKQKEILKKIYHSNNSIRHQNLFELCADIDYTTFRSSVIKELLEDYIKLYEDIYSQNSNHNKKVSAIKSEILLLGRAIILIFDKKKENKNLSRLIGGDQQLFSELNTLNHTIKSSFLDLGNRYVVIARNNTITSCILNILKTKNPEYFQTGIDTDSDNPELTAKLRKLTRKSPELKIDLSKENIKLNTYHYDIDLIKLILSFDNSPRLSVESALLELGKISCDESNSIDDIPEDF